MAIDSLIRELRKADAAEPGAWLVRLLSLAEGLDRELAESRELERVADSLITVAEGLGARSVAGASLGGERLAGAIAARSSGRVHLADGASTLDPLLVVDTLMATGTQVIAAAKTFHETGVRRVMAAALIADPVALDMVRAELGEQVVALETI